MYIADSDYQYFFVGTDSHVHVVAYAMSHSEDEASTTNALETVKQEVYRIVKFRAQNNLCV